jgi:CHAT domain-containing protein/tetratricopeptide (TPR) repeat protein
VILFRCRNSLIAVCLVLAACVPAVPPISAQQLKNPAARRYVSALEQAGKGDYDGAILKLFQFVQEVPAYTPAYSRIAAFAFYTNQIQKADSFFTSRMSSDPGNALYGRGLLARYRERYPEAVEYFVSSIRSAPRCIHPYISLAECYRREKSISSGVAIQLFDSLARCDSSNPCPHVGFAVLYSVNMEKKFGLEHISRAFGLDSSNSITTMYCRAQFYNERYNSYPRDYRYVTSLLERTVARLEETDDQTYASAHYFLGLLYHIRVADNVRPADLRKAVERCRVEYTTAYERARRFGNKEQMSMYLGAIGKYDALVGNYTQASERQKNAARIGHDLGRQDIEVTNLLEAGYAEYMLGNYREAIALYKKSGELESRLPNSRAYELYRRVADIYNELQDYSHALDYIDRAVKMLDSTSYTYGYPLLMTTCSEILIADRQPARALEACESGLRVISSRQAQDQTEGLLMLGVANAYSALGREKGAVQAFFRARKLLEKYAEKTSYLLSLARFHTRYNRLQSAIDTYRSLVAIYTNPTDAWQINYERFITSYEELGDVYSTTGKIDSALASYRAGIAAIEKLRTTVQNEYQAAQLLSQHINLYTNSASLLARRGKLTEAFQVSEQSRARSLHDGIFESAMKFSTSIPEELRIDQFALDQHFQDLNYRLSNAYQTGSSAPYIQNLRDSIDIIEINNRRINADMIRLSGGTQSSSAGLSDLTNIRKCLSDSDAVISYIRTTHAYGAFIITRSGLNYIHMPVERDTIVRLAGSISPWLFRNSHGGNAVSPRIRSFYNPTDAARLSALIFSPLKQYLEGKTHLIIVPDDILHYIPFEALPFSADGTSGPGDFDRMQFLLHHYTIHYLPAVGMTGWIQPRRTHAEERLLAIGNPEFGLNRMTQRQVADTGFASRQRQGLPDSIIVALPYTGEEVHAISSLIEGSIELQGSDATVDRFRSEASRYQILHIATHYFIDDGQPLFSKLLLTPVSSDQTASYLQTFELYRMSLNADLTVLSACNTALGLLQRGEGLNGITQAVMTAGSPSLVVSLWSVDDKSTSILMKYFYTELLSGKTKADALRQAKLHLIDDGYADPLYWAGFILMGDNTPLTLVPRAYPGWCTLFCFMIVFTVLTFLTLYRLRMNKRKDIV